MDAAKIVEMANQIADFFHAYPEPEAVIGVRDHIHAFWTPHMREAAIALAASKASGLDPLARKGLLALAAQEKPASTVAGAA